MQGSHNYWLVLLSVVVAVSASYVALDLSARAACHRGRQRQWYWVAGGAVAMGCGIWTMHFIGMLGFSLPTEVSYDVPITLLSLLIAVLAAGFSLFVASREALTAARLLGAGLLMGVAISAMHYTGMHAMLMQPAIDYGPALVAASVLIAIAASAGGLWAAFKLRMETLRTALWKKAGSAFLVGSAIYGMHYTGMAAAHFAPDAVSTAGPQQFDHALFAGILGALTLLFLAGTLAVSAFDAYVAGKSGERADRLSRRLVEIQDAERRALAAELHDIVGQDLAAANAELAILKTKLAPGLADQAERISGLIGESVNAMRSVMVQLRPPGLEELGLPAALRWHAEAFEARTGIRVTVKADEALPRARPEVEDALLRICLEALRNVEKHAEESHARIALERRDGEIVLSVADDGRGFDAAAPVAQNHASGWGLMIMRERAAALGAELRIRARPGKGTTVELALSESDGDNGSAGGRPRRAARRPAAAAGSR